MFPKPHEVKPVFCQQLYLLADSQSSSELTAAEGNILYYKIRADTTQNMAYSDNFRLSRQFQTVKIVSDFKTVGDCHDSCNCSQSVTLSQTIKSMLVLTKHLIS